MEKSNKESHETQVPGIPAGSPPSEELMAMSQEIAKELEALRDDPCYPVISEKALIKRKWGSDSPWLECVSLEISMVWDIAEVGCVSGDQTKYTLEESYPGYLRIEYDVEKLDKINSSYIFGSYPQKLSSVNTSLRKLEAILHIYMDSPPFEKIVNTNDPSGITIDKGASTGGIDYPLSNLLISNNIPSPGFHSMIINSSHILPNENLIKKDERIIGDVFYPMNQFSAGDVSIEEIQLGLHDKKLEKKFAIHEVKESAPGTEWMRRDGTVTLHINFTKLREHWQVIVNTFNVIGYGDRNRIFGVRVHTERKVDIIIEKGEFKSAEGKTSFISIKPYSMPPGLYRCQEENIEVAGTGTDVEAEQYDQVRNAERFNPPKNPHDAALKEEWLKIEMNKAPYAFPQTYPVKGTKSGVNLDLFFPKDSGYVVSHRCDPSDVFIGEWQLKWRKKWKTHERWTLRDYDRFIFPENIKIILEDNWSTEYNYATSYNGPNVGWKKCEEGTEGQAENTDQISVKRIQ